jgi:hypothetical protein
MLDSSNTRLQETLLRTEGDRPVAQLGPIPGRFNAENSALRHTTNVSSKWFEKVCALRKKAWPRFIDFL